MSEFQNLQPRTSDSLKYSDMEFGTAFLFLGNLLHITCKYNRSFLPLELDGRVKQQYLNTLERGQKHAALTSGGDLKY